MFCFDDYSVAISESLRFGIFTPEVPAIVYYSHITAVAVTLILAAFIISKNRTLPSKILAGIATAFSVLSIFDILLWTQTNADIIMFLWSFWLSLFILIFGLSFYFLYTFIKNHDVRFLYKLIFALIFIAVELFSITTFNLEYFDLSYCEAVEGPIMINAVFAISFIIFIAAMIFGIKEVIKTKEQETRDKFKFATIGIGLFLLIFSFATYIASMLSIFFTDGNYVFLVEQYGYFGMTIFIGFLAYTIVRYKAFDIKMIAANTLVISLVILVASQFLFVRTQAAILLTSVTLVLVSMAGYFMVRSVKKEVKQREEIENLAKSLERANKRLKVLDKMKSEFVSIASHQLRSPLTSIRGYASMLLEGSFGNLSTKAKEAVERIADSSKFMATSVEDYLNVSRIQAGNMKYELSDFNLRDEAEVVVDNIRQQAIKKGLLLTFKSDLEFKGVVNADIGKSRQILQNIINNALKYTPHGSINVVVRDQKRPKRIMIDVIDTGIGMKKETIENMFDKFERADNANSVNVSGTGLGLYIARKMARDMEGDVYASSEGEGKGSTFTFELPLKL